MLADDHPSVFKGELEKGPPDNTSILAVVGFVERHLIDFSQEYTGSTIENEEGLTQELIFLLNLYANKETYPFWFHNEYSEDTERGHSPKVDIGAITKKESIIIESRTYSYKESFFSLEAKRLDKLPKKREKEYLIGRFEKKKYVNSGGVERFKQGIHGGKLKYSAIIAYVQIYDFSHWHKKINSWIEALIQKKIESPVKWTQGDKLKKKYVKSVTAKFISVNSRGKDSITLFHLWTNLSSKKSELK